MRGTYWKKGTDEKGDGWHTSYVWFWKMECYDDNNEPVTGKKIMISYAEYNK
jgi:hypothetical protein